MIETLVVALLAVAALAYVAGPGRGSRGESPVADADLEEAQAKKHAALTALVDIEEERAIGKLSESDFAALRRDYELQAVAALRELEAVKSAATAEDDPVEAEIAAIRAEMTCASCGEIRRPGARCPRCGA